MFIKVLSESVTQAVQQLRANRLRSFLSLMGITIGIFCIIGVLSAVDSLESNVRESVEQLGDDVIYIQKISWAEDPGANYYKYLRRPSMQYDDYEAVKEKVRYADKVSYYVGIGSRTLKYKSNSVDRAYLLGVTREFESMFNLKFEQGRYFSVSEYNYGANKTILGHEVATALFGTVDPIGKEIKIGGRRMEVIGVLEKEGESIVNVMNFDEAVFISYELAKKIANLNAKSFWDNSSVNIKAKEGVNLEDLKAEVTGVLRSERRLKPKEENNFSINQLSILSELLNSFFGVLNLVGIVIGIFSILVGMFSVANIMFVSVKERTKIIGIKKALGAKRWVILSEFLIESVILCILGGGIGLVFVSLILAAISGAIDFDLYLSANNAAMGVGISVFIGIVAGMIPATKASGMDPVNAMRK